MTPRRPLPPAVRAGIGRPLLLTRAGMVAERAARAFWPLWSILLAVLAALMLGLHESLPLEAVWAVCAVAGLGALWAAVRGTARFRWPSAAEALDRLDRTLPGRPIAALSDEQAVGTGDDASRRVWDAHVARMAARVRAARPVRPDLRMAARDPFALRYVALLAFAVALLFGSVWRVGTVGQIAPGAGQAVAGGPAWEGWIEPPAYTGRPSLYLADLPQGEVAVPEGSNVTLRLYGEAGALSVSETVSAGESGASEAAQQDFEVARSGEISLDGAGGRDWQIAMTPDAPPAIEVTGEPERAAGGEFRQPFRATDDFGVTGGKVRIELDTDRVERRYGLTTEPDPREPLVVDLPLPISGDRGEFTGTLVETFSEHPWANLPVTLTYEVTDAMGQAGSTGAVEAVLAGQRFFDPLAQAIVEQRRDLLWSRDNAARVAGILRAVSWQPQEVFSSDALYLRLRVAIRRLEAGLAMPEFGADRQQEIADELWAIAGEIEFGDLDDARERLDRARERLSEAMENGADPAEIAELMQELREATDDYMRQLAEQGQQEDNQQAMEDGQRVTGDQLQQLMDEIQRLMEEGRMAEAQELMEQLNRMMENMRVTQGQPGQGEGDQTMQDLQETLRDQQELSDESFRGMQEGQPGQQGQQGQQGQSGQGQGQSQGQGQGSSEGQSLADRQQALRDELNRQRGNLPGAGTDAGEAARDSLDRADRSMEGAEDALRDGDTPRALDRQAEAMDALREGMRNLGEAMAQEQQGGGQGEGQARGNPGGQNRDPLGREAGENGQMGSDRSTLGSEDVRRRADELLDEIRRRSGEQDRSDQELDYLRRLLDRF